MAGALIGGAVLLAAVAALLGEGVGYRRGSPRTSEGAASGAEADVEEIKAGVRRGLPLERRETHGSATSGSQASIHAHSSGPRACRRSARSGGDRTSRVPDLRLSIQRQICS